MPAQIAITHLSLQVKLPPNRGPDGVESSGAVKHACGVIVIEIVDGHRARRHSQANTLKIPAELHMGTSADYMHTESGPFLLDIHGQAGCQRRPYAYRGNTKFHFLGNMATHFKATKWGGMEWGGGVFLSLKLVFCSTLVFLQMHT